MAGDWIKFRAELLSHPKFIALYRRLIDADDDCGLLVYTCGDALGIGVLPPSNETVTQRALQCVTESALRDVTLVTLLRIWCAVNAHCKVDGDDALMCPMTVTELDAIAGFDGFGMAMWRVGWVLESGDKTLRFPNFCEFNEPACLRKAALTSAERVRNFRARKASEKHVTKCNGCNDRGEKSREEKKQKRETKAFVPPTVEEVKAYSDEASLSLDANRFVDFYTSKGWLVGKAKMKDWKATARNASREGWCKLGAGGNGQLSADEYKADLARRAKRTRDYVTGADGCPS